MTANTDARSALEIATAALREIAADFGDFPLPAHVEKLGDRAWHSMAVEQQSIATNALAILSALPQVREGDGAPFISAIAQERKRFNEGSPTWNAYGHCIAIIEHVAAAPKPTTEDAIPEGMVRWHGGDRAPEDWDGGVVLCHQGELRAVTKSSAQWVSNIIAYTPKLADPKAAVEAERDA